MARPRLWVAGVAILVLVALPPAGLWSRWEGGAFLVLLAWGLAVATAFTRRPTSRPLATAPALLLVGVWGVLLTLLFWTRASLGVPRVALGDLGLKVGALLGGWAWPALLLAGLAGLPGLARRRPAAGEAAGPDAPPAAAGTRNPSLFFVALAAGTMGWLAHIPVVDALRASDLHRAEATRQTLVEPLATRTGLRALSLVGAPGQLDIRPSSFLLAVGESDSLVITGRTFPGTRSDLSRPAQGTEVVAADPSVAEAVPALDGDRWMVRARGPGTTPLEIRVGGASRWMGVRVLPPEGSSDAHVRQVVDVTDRVDIQADATRAPPPDGGFALRQVVRVTNRADVALVGALHLVVGFSADAEPVLVGTRRISDPGVLEALGVESDGPTDAATVRVSAVELIPGQADWRPLVPVLPPGETASLELRVVAPLDPSAPGVQVRVFSAWRL